MKSVRLLQRAVVLAALGALVSCGGLSGPGRAPLTPGAAACSVASLTNPAASPGLGGTGAPLVRGPDPGGIGGTGQVARGEPSGLGGTGSPMAVAEPGVGGTGIVGVVTGFASICVNGVEVEDEPGTPVQRDGRAGRISELAVGQVVALQATGQGDQLRARRIAVLDAAVGPVTALEPGTGGFQVMGQRAMALERDDLRGLAVGDWVRVSGQRVSSGEIRATRVQRTEPGNAWVSGRLVDGGAGGLRIGDTPVQADVAPPASSQGVEVGARGEWADGRLRVREWQVQPARAAVAGARDVLLQGYVHGLQGRELRLGYESLTLGDQLRVEGGDLEALRIDQRVQVRGRVDEQQRVTVERLEFRTEGRRGADRSAPASAATGAPASTATAGDDSDARPGSGGSGSGDSGRGRGRGRGGDSGSSGSGSSGGDSDSGRGRGRGGDSGSSGSGSSGSGSSGSGSSGSGSSGSGSSGSGSSGGDSDGGKGRGRGRGRSGGD